MTAGGAWTDPATVLRDQRVLLRAWRAADVPDVVASCVDEEVQRWTTVPSPYTTADAEAFVAGCPASWAAGRPSFAVVSPDGGRPLGSIGFVGDPPPGVAEVGFWVAPWARRAGVATAATRLVCDWAFEVTDLVRLEWMALVGNTASRAVAQRCGFRFEGTLRARSPHRGAHADIWVAGLLRDDPRPWHRPT